MALLALGGFVGTLPLAAHVVFDGPDMCRITDPTELKEAVGFYILTCVMMLLALSTPRFVTPRRQIHTRWGPIPPGFALPSSWAAG